MRKLSILIGLCICSILPTYSQTETDSIIIKKEFKDNYWNRLFNGNVDRTFEKKIDLSFVVAPSYTREASFGIGGMATALYRADRRDSITPPSNITVTFNASVKGFFALSTFGNHNFKGGKSRLDYQLAFFNKNLNLWGLTFDDCNTNPTIRYRQQQYKLNLNYHYEVLKHFYAGALFDFSYMQANKVENIAYFLGQKSSYLSTGLGLSLQYDSRDFIPNPKKGLYVKLQEIIYPKVFGTTGRTLWKTTFVADYYQKLWTGAVLAFDLYAQVGSDDLPWTMREELGGADRMRGYYLGRYIDNNIASTQIELRQHIAWRIGATAWVGAGTVFPTIQKFDIRNVLPTYGIGLRFEIKHNMNARVDFGFGKQTSGFVFGISEAF